MVNTAEEIVIVTTGGTIDKTYFDALSSYQVGETVVQKLLTIARVTLPFRIAEAFRKDSLELTDEDREQLRLQILALDAIHIVVTHGTDTMTATAQTLSTIAGKTMVLTGALAPARFSESDAAFNLGMAFAVAQTAPPGVYITMNGQVFNGNAVRKDHETARFVAIES
jgi:L-asparaginase